MAIYVILATVGIGSNFLVQKLYQKRYCNSFKAVAFFPVMMALLSAFVYFALNGFKIEVEGFSLLMALLLAITNAHNNLVGLVIMRHCNMSFYSMFLMMGGMFLPFWYGVLLSPIPEPFTVFKAIGLIFLIVGLLCISINKGGQKTSKLGLLLCICVFIMNGFQSTLSKIHQTYATLGTPALGSEAFIMWTMIFTIVMSFIIYLVVVAREKYKLKALQVLGEISLDEPAKEDKVKRPKKDLAFQAILVLIVVIISCVSGLSNTIAQLGVPASVIFPITTGGSIIIMSVGGMIFYKEKSSTRSIIGVCLALVAVILFSI